MGRKNFKDFMDEYEENKNSSYDECEKVSKDLVMHAAKLCDEHNLMFTFVPLLLAESLKLAMEHTPGACENVDISKTKEIIEINKDTLKNYFEAINECIDKQLKELP